MVKMMTTRMLIRDWRLLSLGLPLLALLWAGLTLYAHWGAFLQWCLATQIMLHRYLVMYLLQLNNHQYSGGMWLLGGAFLYGVLHVVGPGHGKFIVTTYLSTNKESLLAARVVPFLGSLMRGERYPVCIYSGRRAEPCVRRSQYQPLVRRENQRPDGGGVWRICDISSAQKPAAAKNDDRDLDSAA